jgi:pimeloyl-ACP methyl ester carboxylesterase
VERDMGNTSTIGPQSGVAKSSDGVPIHYDVYGTTGPALVFVHGWCCSRRHWDKQTDHFAAHYKVVTIDLGGHGESGRARSRWTMQAFAQDVGAVVEQLGVEQYLLIGHSMGGSVIVEAARRMAKPPLGLVGVDTWRNLDQVLTSEQVAEMLAPFRTNYAGAARAFVDSMFLPTSPATLVEQISGAMSGVPEAIGLGAMEELRGFGREVQLGMRATKAPKVLINSTYRPTDIEAARRYGIEVHLMPNVGHFVMIEAPQAFNQRLEAVLATMLSRSRQ